MGSDFDNTMLLERLCSEPSMPLATGLDRTYTWLHDELARRVGADRATAATRWSG
jgi:hypothetical protein